MAYLVMAPATFNYYLKQLKQVDNQQQIKDKIKNIYHSYQSGYSYRRITFALKQMGFTINHTKYISS